MSTAWCEGERLQLQARKETCSAFGVEVLHFQYCATEKLSSSKLFYLNPILNIYVCVLFIYKHLYNCVSIPSSGLKNEVFWAISDRSHKVGKWHLSHVLPSDQIVCHAQITLNIWLQGCRMLLRLLLDSVQRYEVWSFEKQVNWQKNVFLGIVFVGSPFGI